MADLGSNKRRKMMAGESARLASHEALPGSFDKCLLLYSGGLDTSVMLKWIQENYSCKVVALTIDIGQTADDLTAIKKKAVDLGAVDAVVYDAKEEFASQLCVEAIRANADYQGGYALGCPLGRVMISKVAVKVAKEHGCTVIAHGCTGKGNDQVRFEGYCTTLNPELKMLAPVREWGMGRDEELAYAEKHKIPVKQTKSSPYSYDENMWANTAEGAEIEDPSQTPQLEKILLWCKMPEKAPDKPEEVTIGYEKGTPVSINGEKFAKTADLIKKCNSIVGGHGAGFHILIEDRIVGLKVRGVYENPAASLLILGHKKLEYLVSTREQNEFKAGVDQKWAYLCYGAKYFDPLMDNLRAYLEDAQKRVTGTAKIRLYKGTMMCIAVDSPNTMLNTEMASFNQDFGAFNQESSPGFIELWNLPQKTAYNVQNQQKK